MILGPYLSSVLRLLLPAEYRADLARAEESLDNEQLPGSRLSLGKVLLCRGKVKRAREVFSTVERGAGDASEQSLAGAYRLLTDLADFGACRDWAPGTVPLELARRWSMSGWTIERDSWARQPRNLPTEVAQEVWFISEVASLPSEYVSVRSPEHVRPIWQRLRAASERIEQEGLRSEVSLGTSLVNLMTLRLAQQPEGAGFATRWATRYRASGDTLSAGLMELIGQDLATTSRTVPEVIDLYSGDAVDLSRSVLEQLEEGPLPQLPPDPTSVLMGEHPGRTTLEGVEWWLGVAAARVHSATWITRVKPKDVPSTFELNQLVEAKKSFERASDEAGLRLVDCRLLAVSIEQNFPFEEHQLGTMRDIGAWGRTSGSLAFALGLGYFFVAIGRYWRRRGDLARALRALALANALFEALEAPVAIADAAMEEAALLTEGWEAAQAMPSLERALDGYVAAFQAMGTPQGGYLDAWRRLRGRIAMAGAARLGSWRGSEDLQQIQQRLMDLGVMPGMAV